jgi:FkbM family methyltransferase
MDRILDRIILKSAAFAARLLPSSFKQAIYRQPRLARLIRNQLNKAAPSDLVQVQIAGGTLSGKSLILDLQTEKDYWLGTYEPELQAAIQDWVKPGMVVYDIGANIGYIALMMAQATGQSGHVFAFEALPANGKRLAENVALNEYQDRVTVLNYAVIDEPRQVRFWIGPSDDMGKVEGSAGREEIIYQDSILVDGISLDWFISGLGHPEPQLIKIDIEGGEILAMHGMKEMLSQAHPVILIELHGPQAGQVTWEILINCGYEICRMEKGYPKVSGMDQLDWKSYLIAFPKDQLR